MNQQLSANGDISIVYFIFKSKQLTMKPFSVYKLHTHISAEEHCNALINPYMWVNDAAAIV